MGSAALHPWLTKSAALPLATSASCAFSHVWPNTNTYCACTPQMHNRIGNADGHHDRKIAWTSQSELQTSRSDMRMHITNVHPYFPFADLYLGATPRIFLAWGKAVMSSSESQRNPRTAPTRARRPRERYYQRVALVRGRIPFHLMMKRVARFGGVSTRRDPIAPPATHRRSCVAELERAAFSIGRSTRPHSPPHCFHGFRCAPPMANKIRSSAAGNLRFKAILPRIANSKRYQSRVTPLLRSPAGSVTVSSKLSTK